MSELSRVKTSFFTPTVSMYVPLPTDIFSRLNSTFEDENLIIDDFSPSSVDLKLGRGNG